MQQSYEAKLQDLVSKAQDLKHGLTAAQRQVSTLQMSLCKADFSCRQADEDALQLRGHLQDAKSAAQSACSRAQHLEAELLQLRETLNAQSCTSRAATAELEARMADMAGNNAAQQAEIAALHATIQAHSHPCSAIPSSTCQIL